MKRNKLLITLMLTAMTCACVVGLSGCDASDLQSIIGGPSSNPITGEEVESGELPAKPVIVSIPNAPDGAVPQSGISKADIIYEFPVEASLTRLQAVFYSEFPDYVGPCRSVRYYFIDLVREYKACHVGYGWGKRAHNYMHECDIFHINGMQDDSLFERVDFKAAPNNAYIKWENIMERAEEEGWFEESVEIDSWKFRDGEWDKEKEEAQKIIDKKSDSDDDEDIREVEAARALLAEPDSADYVSVTSGGCNSKCEWDSENKCYKRYWYGEPFIDRETGKQLEFSNILVQYVKSNLMTDDETGEIDAKGRLEIDMQSGGDALLFTNGEVIKGTWSKADADSRTVFTDENGNEFAFTQGKTWCYICDQNMNVEYK